MESAGAGAKPPKRAKWKTASMPRLIQGVQAWGWTRRAQPATQQIGVCTSAAEPALQDPDREAPAEQTCAVIWLHGMGGRGDVEREWQTCFERLPAQHKPENCKWIHPRAPCGPVTFHKGRFLPRWCDTWGDHNSTSWVDNPRDVAESIAIVHKIVRDSGIDSHRVVLGGFSQGAAIALLAALSFPEPLAGCVMFGGWLSHPTADEAEVNWIHSSNAATQVWWGHGVRDRSIPVLLLDEHADIIDRFRPLQKVDRMRYHCGHWPNQEALWDLMSWLRQVLPTEDP